jgi:hypothetical protein
MVDADEKLFADCQRYFEDLWCQAKPDLSLDRIKAREEEVHRNASLAQPHLEELRKLRDDGADAGIARPPFFSPPIAVADAKSGTSDRANIQTIRPLAGTLEVEAPKGKSKQGHSGKLVWDSDRITDINPNPKNLSSMARDQYKAYHEGLTVAETLARGKQQGYRFDRKNILWDARYRFITLLRQIAGGEWNRVVLPPTTNTVKYMVAHGLYQPPPDLAQTNPRLYAKLTGKPRRRRQP